MVEKKVLWVVVPSPTVGTHRYHTGKSGLFFTEPEDKVAPTMVAAAIPQLPRCPAPGFEAYDNRPIYCATIVCL
jgi:hypothetical protein